MFKECIYVQRYLQHLRCWGCLEKLGGGGGVPEYFSSEKYVRKSYREKKVLKTLQLEFSTAVQFYY